MSIHKEIKRVTTQSLQKLKKEGRKISMLTAYDYSMAKLIDGAGIDVILVGVCSIELSKNAAVKVLEVPQFTFEGSKYTPGKLSGLSTMSINGSLTI